MFADTLLRAEQFHFLHVMVWGASNVLAGLAVVLLLARYASAAAALRYFGNTVLVLGLLEMAGAFWGYRGVALRDYAGAVELDRMVWFEAGILLGALAVGLSIAVAAWRYARRLGPVGAGVAVATHAAALLALQLQLAKVIVR